MKPEPDTIHSGKNSEMKSARGAAEQLLPPGPIMAGTAAQELIENDPLLRIDRYLDGSAGGQLADDARRGLTQQPKTLPPKYFYDDRGARLFDEICRQPEYYPTRTEYALLQRITREVMDLTQPTHLVELGSGASRKTRVLIDGLSRVCSTACYVPLDVSEDMLYRSTITLRRAYPQLCVHGIVGDYDRHLQHLPPGGRRLVVFLGSTLGNFAPAEAHEFLQTLGRQIGVGSFLLLGVDLIKPLAVLEAAYNDRAGITAEFNRNVLRVLNRELRADFDLNRFAHVAFFNTEAAQIEMHLRADDEHQVSIAGLDLTVGFTAGETIRTEISRKFTRDATEAMLAQAGFELNRWYVSPDNYFALALAAVRGA